MEMVVGKWKAKEIVDVHKAVIMGATDAGVDEIALSSDGDDFGMRILLRTVPGPVAVRLATEIENASGVAHAAVADVA